MRSSSRAAALACVAALVAAVLHSGPPLADWLGARASATDRAPRAEPATPNETAARAETARAETADVDGARSPRISGVAYGDALLRAEPPLAPPTDGARRRSVGQSEPPAAPQPSFDGIDRLVAAAIARRDLPGAVVVIGRRDGVLYQKAFGSRQVQPSIEPMTEDTIFDVASLTKPIVTATAAMLLAERGKLDLDAPVRRYVDGLGADKRAITVRQLLTHTSGLPAESPFADYERGREHLVRRLGAVKLRAEPGQRFIYSDVGFVLLEEVVRRVSGQELPAFARRHVFEPLGMKETLFLPPAELLPRIAPTEVRDGAMIRGAVHDPRAFRMGGVSGHAGLFSTAADLVRFARMMLAGGELDGKRVLSTKSIDAMTAPHDVPGGIRALGWDVQSRYSMNRGSALSRRAFGHGGYTGTALWLDPELDLFVLFLSNRVHPDGKGSVNQLCGDIATLAGKALAKEADALAASGPVPVRLGIDVLRDEGFARLRGKKIALLTNSSARDGSGARTVDVLARAEGVELVRLLSPEHGFGADREAKIGDSVEDRWQIPIHSLYGKVLSPTPQMLAGVDTIVVDLPDAGVRFYTYASTLHGTLRAAARLGLELVVLDRPNPINAVEVAGPMLHPSERSFVNHHPLPMRHGLTLGELAELVNADGHLTSRLSVVRMQGYRRAAYFDETGLTWWAPSPNLRRVEQVVLYPAVALVEGTNVSVGRGTERPFEVLGAPWIDADALAASFASYAVAGISASPTRFTPNASVHSGQECHGLAFTVTDRRAFEPIRAGIALALALRRTHERAWKSARLHEMIGHPEVTRAILAARPLADIEAMWKDDLDAFRAKRTKYLLYPP